MTSCSIFISDADPSKEEEWRMHEDCYELGMDIPRCMKGANNLAEVEKCLFEVFVSKPSLLSFTI